MPANPADIIRATRQARIVTREDLAIKAVFPNARDGATTPDPGYFESAADAAAALGLKAKLMGAFRRRFLASVADEVWIDPTTGIPTAQLIDTEQNIDVAALVTRMEVDLETETSRLELMG